MSRIDELPPLLLADLFPEISQHLLALLRSLLPAEWQLPTSSSRRTVKDIASHLLDGSLRRLSFQRDQFFPADAATGQRPGEPLLDFLNRLNEEWETATRRLSPAVLISLIEWADRGLAELFATLDPFGPAISSVAWAGEAQSANWMDVARDYTEKWHHTQQIFDATGRLSTITGRRLFHPCLDAFLRALPFTFRDVQAPEGTTVSVVVTGEAGGTWRVERGNQDWRLVVQPQSESASTVTLDQLTAWRLVTKRRSRELIRELFPRIVVAGDLELGSHVLDMVSMMA